MTYPANYSVKVAINSWAKLVLGENLTRIFSKCSEDQLLKRSGTRKEPSHLPWGHLTAE